MPQLKLNHMRSPTAREPGLPQDSWTNHTEPRAPRHRPEAPRLVKALMKKRPAVALAMLEYARLTADNDNFDSAELEGFGIDRTWGGDDVADMVSDAYRTRVVTEKRRAGANAPPRSIIFRHAPFTDASNPFDTKRDGARISVGSMVFDPHARPAVGGMLVEFGRNKRGEPIVPDYEPKAARGVRPVRRGLSSIMAYLQRPSAALCESGYRRPFSGFPALLANYNPLPAGERKNRFGVEKARELLQSLGIDGGVQFDVARRAAGLSQADPLPAAIAKGAEFGGVTQGGDDSPKGGIVFDLLNHADVMRERDAAVIEEALSGGTFQDIGRIVGARASRVGKVGKTAFLEAVEIYAKSMPIRHEKCNIPHLAAA